MSASTRHAVVPIVALILSFVTVFMAGQLTYAISPQNKGAPVTPASSPPTPELPAVVPNEIKGEIAGTFDLGTVQPNTTFEGPVLGAHVVPMGGGRYRVCVTPPHGTTVEGGGWSTNGDHRPGQYCHDLNPGDDVKVVVTP
jgi:hypothetical protein